MNKEIEIPEGYEARIEGNKVILEAKKSKIKIGTQVTAKLYPTKATVIGTFQGYDIEDQEDPTSICGKVFYVKDGVRHLNFVYVDSIKVCDSKDEKVRKALLRCCDDWEKGQFGCMAKEDIPAIRTYLEKQKEPRDYRKLYEEVVKSDWFKENYVGKSLGEEQKPAEWSEEDEFMRTAVIQTLERFGGRGTTGMQIDWLKSLRPLPKQEVVDRNVFYRIADILRWCDLPIGCPVENFKESESEREHLLEIVQCVAHRYDNSCTYCTYCKEYSRGYQDGLAVHHWKPSEEQMIALNHAFAYYISEGNHSTGDRLKSLYNDLEKL